MKNESLKFLFGLACVASAVALIVLAGYFFVYDQYPFGLALRIILSIIAMWICILFLRYVHKVRNN